MTVFILLCELVSDLETSVDILGVRSTRESANNLMKESISVLFPGLDFESGIDGITVSRSEFTGGQISLWISEQEVDG